MLKQARFHISAFLAAAVLTGIGMTMSDAEALYTRNHASKCTTFNGKAIDQSFAIKNDSTSSRMRVLCPVPDDNRFPKGSVKIVNIHGYDGNMSAGVAGQVRARTCRTSSYATSGGCSALKSSNDTEAGHYVLSPSTVFGNAGDFVYIFVEVPVKHGSSQSTIRGYYTSN